MENRPTNNFGAEQKKSFTAGFDAQQKVSRKPQPLHAGQGSQAFRDKACTKWFKAQRGKVSTGKEQGP